METCTAILAEVAVIIGIFYAEPLRAVGIALAAVNTEFAELAHIHVVVAGSAIVAEMLLPSRRIYAVFATGAALALSNGDATFGAKSAIGAEFKVGASGASFALLAEEFLGAIGAMSSVSAVLAPIIGMLAAGIAVSTLFDCTFRTEITILTNLADKTFSTA